MFSTDHFRKFFIEFFPDCRHLDLSQSNEIHGRSNEKNGTYEKPNQILATIVESLPLLKCLDISGTNLAGTGELNELVSL